MSYMQNLTPAKEQHYNPQRINPHQVSLIENRKVVRQYSELIEEEKKQEMRPIDSMKNLICKLLSNKKHLDQLGRIQLSRLFETILDDETYIFNPEQVCEQSITYLKNLGERHPNRLVDIDKIKEAIDKPLVHTDITGVQFLTNIDHMERQKIFHLLPMPKFSNTDENKKIIELKLV